jgi:transposase
VIAGLTPPYTNGLTEDTVNSIKMIKHSGYGESTSTSSANVVRYLIL